MRRVELGAGRYRIARGNCALGEEDDMGRPSGWWRWEVVRLLFLLLLVTLAVAAILNDVIHSPTRELRWHALQELPPYLWAVVISLLLMIGIALRTGKLPRSQAGRATAPRAFWSYIAALSAFMAATLTAIWYIFQGP